MGLKAEKHLRVTTGGREPLTLKALQEFLDAAHDAGIPGSAALTQPGRDLLLRIPLTFEVVWSEDL